MKPITTPEPFLSAMRNLGVDDVDTHAYFEARQNNRSAESIFVTLVAKGSFATPAEAGRIFRREYRKWNEQRIVAFQSGESKSVRTSADPEDLLSEATYALEKIIGKLGTGGFVSRRTSKGRIAWIADIHVPFHDEEAIAAVCEDPAEELVIAGDVLDMYASGRYRKEIGGIDTAEELAQGRALLEMFSRKFKKVSVIEGNHDIRGLRRIQDTFPQLLPLIVSPLEILCKGLPNVEILSSIVPKTAPRVSRAQDLKLGFLAMVGDTAVCHFENFSGADAPLKSLGWLDQWSHVLQLQNRRRLIIQAHTHRLHIQFQPDGTVVAAPGCLCRPMPYQVLSQGIYQPPTVGYMATYQSEGVTNLRNIEVVPL